jgi:hypothetical protein
MDKFKLSISAMTDLERADSCPDKWHDRWVLKTFSSEPNINQKMGLYFEYLCIGKTAKEGEIPDMPLTKTGKKSIDIERIAEQAKRYKMLFDPESKYYLGFEVLATQVKEESDKETGRLDLFVATKSGYGIIDIKLTADVQSTFGPFCWGDLRNKDWGQLIHYFNLKSKELIKLNLITKKDELEVYVLVFDYSPRMGIKLFDLKFLDSTLVDFEERKNVFWNIINTYNKIGWSKLPSKTECEGCPISCDERFKPDELKIERETCLV